VVASVHATARRRFSAAAWKRKSERLSATSVASLRTNRAAFGAGDTFVVARAVGTTVLGADGGRVDLSVRVGRATVAVGDAIGWHPTTADAARLMMRSIRFTRSVLNDLVVTASHLEDS
jgi:hypothetical protein